MAKQEQAPAPVKQNGNQAAPPPAVASMTIEAALKLIEQKAPEAFNLMSAVVRKDIVALGTDEAFALRTKDGTEIRAFKEMLTLSEAEGTLNKPVKDGPYCVDAQGYEKWANTVGAQRFFPQRVLVNNNWVENKYPTYDENHRLVSYHVRTIAYRYNAKGILIWVDWTTIYDVRAYRLIDLLAKAKYTPQAFRLLPNDMGKPDNPGTWAHYPLDESTTLWINTSHDEALNWYSTIMNREKKCLDIAQTFGGRNAFKHLSAIQKAPGNKWSFPVISWRTTNGDMVKLDEADFMNMQKRVGELSDTTGRRPQIALLSSGTERVEDEEASIVETEEQITDEDQANAIDVKPEKVTEAKQGPGPSNSNVQKNLAVAKKEFHAEYLAACQSLEIEPDADLTDDQAQKIMTAISLALDKAA